MKFDSGYFHKNLLTCFKFGYNLAKITSTLYRMLHACGSDWLTVSRVGIPLPLTLPHFSKLPWLLWFPWNSRLGNPQGGDNHVMTTSVSRARHSSTQKTLLQTILAPLTLFEKIKFWRTRKNCYALPTFRVSFFVSLPLSFISYAFVISLFLLP